MASQVRLSPLGIFSIILFIFIMLYFTKYYYFTEEDTVIDHLNIEIQKGSFITSDKKEGNKGDTISLIKLIQASILFAEKGGALLKKIREENDLKQKLKGLTKEGVEEAVTEGDMQSHEAIVHGLQQMFPKLPIISEEHEKTMDNDSVTKSTNSDLPNILDALIKTDDELVDVKDILVWVDPLDATKEYTEKLLEYVTTMVCVVYKNQPIVGIIHQPFLPKTTWAWVGHGHSKQVSKPSEQVVIAPRIIVSRSHAGKVNMTARKAFNDNIKIIPAGGAGFKVLSLFNNVADAYIHTTLIKKWDICAGNALLSAFGGRMTTLHGEDILYGDKDAVKNEGGLLATLNNHDEFLKRLSSVDMTQV